MKFDFFLWMVVVILSILYYAPTLAPLVVSMPESAEAAELSRDTRKQLDYMLDLAISTEVDRLADLQANAAVLIAAVDTITNDILTGDPQTMTIDASTERAAADLAYTWYTFESIIALIFDPASR